MLEGPQVFVDIDTQRDFLEPQGSLFVPGGTEIRPNLGHLTHFAQALHFPILASACCHYPDDPELKIFPPHCMKGTLGQTRVEETDCVDSLILDHQATTPDPLPKHLTLLKQELDLFSHPCADDLITRYKTTCPVFVVYGVATDYCVKAAVEGLLTRWCRVAVVVDAIRAINAHAEAELLTTWAKQGALLLLTEVVCDLRSRIPWG
jgi:nicotinamidase/pyrazinamidase